MKRSWDAITPISRRPRSPNTAIAPETPLTWSTNVNPTLKAIRLEKGVLSIQTPNRPSLQRPQGYQLQMGRSPADASRNIRIATAQIRAPIARRH